MKFLVFFCLSFALSSAGAAAWEKPLQSRIVQLDQKFEGNLGVFVRKLSDNTFMNHQGDRAWYLASTTKIPIAISVFKEVEAGRLRLEQKLALQKSDFVDGSGRTLYDKPGSTFTVHQLLERMMVESDSTATDMLVRLLGDQLDVHVKKVAPQFGKITKILDVRFDAYSELHPKAKNLTNMNYLELRKFPHEQRAAEFAKMIKVPVAELKYPTAEEAFEAYYKSGKNSGSLVEFATLLGNLAHGKLLNTAHTEMLLNMMTAATTGEKRIKNGLPENMQFAQKTGTQIARVCNVGIIYKTGKIADGVVVAACAEKFKDQEQAEKALEGVGELIAGEVLTGPRPVHKN